MPADGFYAPEGYSAWWPLAGAALVLLCLGWVGWVLVHTRTGHHVDVPEFVAPRNPAAVRSRYLARITSLQSQYDAGTLAGRAAHLGFSSAVRSFVYEMTGVPAQRMTLAELREHQLPRVADAVAAFYPAEFGRAEYGPAEVGGAKAGSSDVGGAGAGSGSSVGASAEKARAVVATWR